MTDLELIAFGAQKMIDYGLEASASFLATQTQERRDAIIADGSRRARESMATFVTAIEQKNIARLEATLNRLNPISCEVFTLATGVALGKTDKAIRASLRQWIGADVYDTCKTTAAQERLTKQAEREQIANKRRIDAKLGEKVRWVLREVSQPDGSVLPQVEGCGTRREWIDLLLSSGYLPRPGKKRGICETLELCDGRRLFTLATKIEREYAIQQHANLVA